MKTALQKNSIIALTTQKEYNKAWEDFWRMGRQLQKLWKTKKTILEVLREERNW